jgi:hypothetical protein
MKKCHTRTVNKSHFYNAMQENTQTYKNFNNTFRLVYNVYAQITGPIFHKLTKSYHYQHTTILTIYKMKKCKVIHSIYNSETVNDKKFLILKGNHPICHVKRQLKL